MVGELYMSPSPKMIGFISHSILSPLWLDFILHYGWFYNPICFVHVSENMGFPKRSMFNPKARIKFVYYILYYILYHILYIILYIIVPGSHFRLRKSRNRGFSSSPRSQIAPTMALPVECSSQFPLRVLASGDIHQSESP